MAINPALFDSQPIGDNYDVSIELLTARPTPGEYMTNPVQPNRLVGYYDALEDVVELYMSDATGWDVTGLRSDLSKSA